MRIFIALFLCTVLCTSCTSKTPTKTFNSLQVCQFNMRYGVPNDGRVLERKEFSNGSAELKLDGSQTWEKRLPLIKSFIDYNEIDVCGTQELSWFQVDAFKDFKGYKFIGEPTAPSKYVKKIPSANNIILYKTSRLEVLKSGSFWLSETPDKESNGFGANKPRNCNWALFKDKKNGSKFFFFNTHFHHIGEQTQFESSKLFIKKIKEIAQKIPFIAVGDFNSTEDSRAIQEMKKAGFIDARKICKTPLYGVNYSDNFGYTGLSSITFPTTRMKSKKLNLIDWVFVSNSVEVQKYAILSECFDGVWLSDHFPILLKINVK